MRKQTKVFKMLLKAVQFEQRYQKSHVKKIPIAVDIRNKDTNMCER